MAKPKGLTLSQALEQVTDRPIAAKPAAPPPITAPAPKPKAVEPSSRVEQPSRQGTKTVAGHFPTTVSKQLKQLALDKDSNVQELLREALNDLFRKYGKQPLA
jgi:hypothetical protein